MQELVLELTQLSKEIKGKKLVKNIDLKVYASEIFGFLGPNGAGKTTTIRMIVGLARPSHGKVSICGHCVENDFSAAMSNVGCIIESPDMYKYLSGLENLNQFAAMDKRITPSRIDEVVKLVGLDHRIHDKVAIYSLGMRQRLGIAQAILSRPKLLILDEPTNGLDPAGIVEFRQLIRKLAYEEGMAVFVSSHILSEVQQMCDTVAIISKGEVVKTAKVSEIGTERIVEWQVDDPVKVRSLLQERWQIEAEQIRKDTLKANIGDLQIEEINGTFIREGVQLLYCIPRNSTLEDLFLNLTGGDEIV